MKDNKEASDFMIHSLPKSLNIKLVLNFLDRRENIQINQ